MSAVTCISRPEIHEPPRTTRTEFGRVKETSWPEEPEADEDEVAVTG